VLMCVCLYLCKRQLLRTISGRAHGSNKRALEALVGKGEADVLRAELRVKCNAAASRELGARSAPMRAAALRLRPLSAVQIMSAGTLLGLELVSEPHLAWVAEDALCCPETAVGWDRVAAREEEELSAVAVALAKRLRASGGLATDGSRTRCFCL
jgi:hypothetical protein